MKRGSACRYALESEDCAGIAIWQFSDTRSYVTGEGIYSRPKGMNNKGILDEYRRPKLAWYRLKDYIGSWRKAGN